MKVGPVSLGVDKFDPCRFQVGLKSLHGRHHTGEDSRLVSGQFGNVQAHFGCKVRMQGNHGLLVILGRGGANINERLLAFQVEVIPLQSGHFTAAQAGVNGGEVNDLPSFSNSQEALHFVISEGAPGADLPAVCLHLLDVLEGITGDSFVLFHPVQE